MKKIIVFTFVLFSIYSAVLAQDKKVNFGLQAGYSYNMPKINTVKYPDNLNGFHLGPIISYNINETIGIQSGLLYNYSSGIYKEAVVLDSWRQYKTKFQSIDLPLRAQYSIGLADDFFLKLLIGPNFNFGLNRVTDYEVIKDKQVIYVANVSSKGENIYNNSNYSRFDVQFGIGVAVQYYGFSIRAGYDWGLLDRDKTTNSFKANDIKLGIAYTF